MICSFGNISHGIADFTLDTSLVPSLNEFARCTDYSPDCKLWKVQGECDVNPAFMYYNCSRECKVGCFNGRRKKRKYTRPKGIEWSEPLCDIITARLERIERKSKHKSLMKLLADHEFVDTIFGITFDKFTDKNECDLFDDSIDCFGFIDKIDKVDDGLQAIKHFINYYLYSISYFQAVNGDLDLAELWDMIPSNDSSHFIQISSILSELTFLDNCNADTEASIPQIWDNTHCVSTYDDRQFVDVGNCSFDCSRNCYGDSNCMVMLNENVAICTDPSYPAEDILEQYHIEKEDSCLESLDGAIVYDLVCGYYTGTCDEFTICGSFQNEGGNMTFGDGNIPPFDRGTCDIKKPEQMDNDGFVIAPRPAVQQISRRLLQSTTTAPTRSPTTDPTGSPSTDPTQSPTTDPTRSPITDPTHSPTTDPTRSPTTDPTRSPTTDPTHSPTTDPTRSPSADPTLSPTTDPTHSPTTDPTRSPTTNPTRSPSADPTHSPTADPTASPSVEPTVAPSTDPTVLPTIDPTVPPTIDPTVSPTTNATVSAAYVHPIINILIPFHHDAPMRAMRGWPIRNGQRVIPMWHASSMQLRWRSHVHHWPEDYHGRRLDVMKAVHLNKNLERGIVKRTIVNICREMGDCEATGANLHFVCQGWTGCDNAFDVVGSTLGPKGILYYRDINICKREVLCDPRILLSEQEKEECARYIAWWGPPPRRAPAWIARQEAIKGRSFDVRFIGRILQLKRYNHIPDSIRAIWNPAAPAIFNIPYGDIIIDVFDYTLGMRSHETKEKGGLWIPKPLTPQNSRNRDMFLRKEARKPPRWVPIDEKGNEEYLCARDRRAENQFPDLFRGLTECCEFI